MDFSTMALIYSPTAVVVAIISATIIRANLCDWDRFGIEDAFLSMLFGVVWPLTVFAVVVYLASDFLCRKLFKKRES